MAFVSSDDAGDASADGAASDEEGGNSGPARFRVGVIGFGKVGSVIAGALADVGHQIVSVAAVSDQSRARAASVAPEADIVEIPEVVSSADLVVLAVPDDVLTDLVAGLAATGQWREDQFVVHTAGRYGLAPLEPATAKGALPFALHPAMTFTGGDADRTRLRDAVFGVTSLPPWRPVAEAMVLELGAEPVWIPDELRVTYHAALSHGANHLVTLISQARDILKAASISHPDRVLRPLVEAALDNSLRSGDAALTGPVARGDAGTVAAHLEQLNAAVPATLGNDVPMAYRAMAAATVQRALASDRLRLDQALSIIDALEEDQ